MTCIVKCPICKANIKLLSKPKYYFKHCNISHDIVSNLIAESYQKYTEKVMKNDENGRKREKNEKNRQGNSTGISDQTVTTRAEDSGIGKTTEREKGNFLAELGIEQRRTDKAKTENGVNN